jgi:sulfhydrogenase subunit beta (sulfur reductase)
MTEFFLPYEKFQYLIEELSNTGYQCIGPQVKSDAIVYAKMNDIKQLPWGVRELQARGSYQLTKHDNSQAFAWANGPQAVKPLVFTPQETVFKLKRDANGKLSFKSQAQAPKQALLGIRPCDLHALMIQDKVFLESEYVDPFYKARREQLFLCVVNCSYSSANCFCLTADGHPKASSGFDLALTEIDGGFVAEFASTLAQEYLQRLDLIAATKGQRELASKKIEQAIDGQTKVMPKNITQRLLDNPHHPQWDDVASRCLSCGNCTQVCPTCFCHRQTEKPSLDGESSEHIREWDSCFTKDHSYIHGMTIRASTKQRYRQWLTHKLATWHEQFGTSGCVGCGRCISWCPSEIDITEEVTKIMEDKA